MPTSINMAPQSQPLFGRRHVELSSSVCIPCTAPGISLGSTNLELSGPVSSTHVVVPGPLLNPGLRSSGHFVSMSATGTASAVVLTPQPCSLGQSEAGSTAAVAALPLGSHSMARCATVGAARAVADCLGPHAYTLGNSKVAMPGTTIGSHSMHRCSTVGAARAAVEGPRPHAGSSGSSEAMPVPPTGSHSMQCSSTAGISAALAAACSSALHLSGPGHASEAVSPVSPAISGPPAGSRSMQRSSTVEAARAAANSPGPWKASACPTQVKLLYCFCCPIESSFLLNPVKKPAEQIWI